MILIWGWRALRKTLATGMFHCPSCGTDRPYRHKEARRWFTFFFIPIIPLNVLGDYIECNQCKGTFKTVVLSTPTASDLTEQLLGAVREGLVAVLGTDPTPGAREEAVAMLSAFAGREWQPGDLDNDLAHLTAEHLSARLAVLATVLSEQGKERLVGGFARVAATGGVLNADQRSVVERIAGEIGMTSAHVRGVIDEVIEKV